MNAKLTAAAAVVVTGVVADIVILNVRARRELKRAAEITDQPIVETYNRITRQWVAAQDEVNSHPTTKRIDAILARFDHIR